jgi:acetylornithine deacetylase/succinyl-diaminopimelate desuccinylase-like protein
MDLDPIFEHIDENLEETLRLLQEYVRQPSVSVGDGSGMRECAALVADHYRSLGCQEVETVETETFPGVWAYFDAGAPHTILAYDMYDVRSVGDPGKWTHDPFGAEIERRGDIPSVLYGRGAHVPKGPAVAFISALRSIKAVTGSLPVNVAFLAEGDEILGSQSYAGLMRRYRDRLAKVDGWVYVRGTQNQEGELPIVLGYKTFITFELRASGARWARGPVEMAAHSATGPIVDNPATRLVQAVATLFDASGQVAIDGWRESFAPLTVPEEDQENVEALIARFQGQDWRDAIPGLAGTGLQRFAGDVEGPDVLVRYIYGSQLNLQGIYGGYTGPGTRTYTIPEKAAARFDTRLVSSKSPEQLIEDLRQHLDRRGYSDIEVDLKSAYPGSTTSPATPLVQSFLRAVDRAGGRPTIWPRQGYGGPWAFFASAFDLPVIHATGIGHGGGVGLPDEFIVVDGGGKVSGLREMQRFYVDFLSDFAGSAPRT